MSSRTLAVRVALPVAALAVVGAVAAPALAASHSHKDATGDVYKSANEGATVTPDPTNKTADITGLVTSYSGKSLVITGTLRAVASDFGAIAEIKTSTPKPYGVFVSVSKGKASTIFLADGKISSCAGLSAKVTTARKTVAVTIPAACFGAPASIKDGFGVFVQTTSGSTTTYHADDAQSTGVGKDLTTMDLTLGPAIKHG